MKDEILNVARPLAIHQASENAKYVRRRRAWDVGLRRLARMGKKRAEVTKCILHKRIISIMRYSNNPPTY